MTFELSTHSQALPTSFAEDSPARTSATQASAPERPEPVQDCFGNWCDAFAWWDRGTQSWRTWQTSFIEGWETFAGSWPRAGFVSNGIAFKRPTLERPTNATASGSLPTPTHGSSRQGLFHPFDGGSAARKKARKMGLMPTPTVNGNYNRAGLSEKSGDGLFTAIRSGWDGPIGATALVRFVEWMMGYPADWTRLNQPEMPSSQKSRTSSAARSSKRKA